MHSEASLSTEKASKFQIAAHEVLRCRWLKGEIPIDTLPLCSVPDKCGAAQWVILSMGLWEPRCMEDEGVYKFTGAVGVF